MPQKSLKKLFELHRWQKQFLMLIADCMLLSLAVWFSYAVRLGDWMPTLGNGFWLMILSPIVSIPIFIRFGFYRAVIRYIGSQAFMAIIKGALLSTLAMALLVVVLKFNDVPRSLFLLYFGFVCVLVGGSRYLVRHYYYYALHLGENSTAIAIYGAGQTGMQLASSLAKSRAYSPVAFIDDNVALQNTVVQGLKVVSPAEIDNLIKLHRVQQVLLALPSADNTSRKTIIRKLENFPVHVRSIPNLSDLVSGKSSLEELHEVDIEDLLGRTQVAPDKILISDCIANKNVIVTGAGGSIGSELCRQILRQAPTILVLFDISEAALYQIDRELGNIALAEGLIVQIVPVIGSVADAQRIEESFRQYRIQLVFHAAAYKHVPLVEQNPIEGIRNNSFGTLIAAKSAIAANVERFILVSTDKAVRPTNVMGASKRLAEMALQSLAQEDGETIFAMVRFGNVMGSSGSVVPLFRKQIQAGGPVTVTHPDIIRFFMTIPEAAQLVLQAGAMAKGGEIFLLDMGEPVSILELAKRMIKLTGAKIQLGAHPVEGAIAIEFTGLRPGEKLYEELLISGSPRPTAHPQILRGEDGCISYEELQKWFSRLEEDCTRRDLDAVYKFMMSRVEGCTLTLAS